MQAEKHMISGIPESMYLTKGVKAVIITPRAIMSFTFIFVRITNSAQVILRSTILQIIGDKRFQPKTNPQSIQGVTSTGLHAANERRSAWLSLNPKYPLGYKYPTVPSTCLK